MANNKEQANHQLDFSDLQANILRYHGRKHVRCLFLQFNGTVEACRDWVETLEITSAEDQKVKRKAFKDSNGREDGGTVTCFLLSANGFRKLGYTDDDMPGSESFRLGMKNGIINGALHDPPSGKWEQNYRQRIDAMILLADNDVDRLNRLSGNNGEIAISLAEGKEHKVGRILFVESGSPLSSKTGEPREHFGFLDGLSNPEILDGDDELKGDEWKIALDSDNESNEVNGSYFVFRKLEQDVEAFNQQVDFLHQESGIPIAEIEARIIGRRKNDGSPLHLPQGSGTSFADYSNDTGGAVCPFHAHIRKSNPRDNALPSEPHRIVRRGITYGGERREWSDEEMKFIDVPPKKEVGLLFMCYQASIEDQFEFIQKNWFNNPDFPQNGNNIAVGSDPIVGQHLALGENQSNPWIIDDKGTMKRFNFGKVVTLLGGEYFYAPTINFLTNLPPLGKDAKAKPARRYRKPGIKVGRYLKDYAK